MPDFNATCLECRHPLHDSMLSEVCPECGRPFHRRDPDTFNRVVVNPVMLTRGPIVEVGALRAALEAQGIHAALHEEVAGIIGHIVALTASIWVDRDDAPAALSFMHAFQEAHTNTGAPDDQSPEPLTDWACLQCNQTIEGQFDTCWECGVPRSDVDGDSNV